MRKKERLLLWALLLCPAARAVAAPGASEPRVGYLYPAGGKQGTTFQVSVGDQFLNGASAVHVSGEGVRGTVPHTPLEQPADQELQKRLRALAPARQAVPPPTTAANDSVPLWSTHCCATWAQEPRRVGAVGEAVPRSGQRRRINPQLSKRRCWSDHRCRRPSRNREIDCARPPASPPIRFQVGRLPGSASRAGRTAGRSRAAAGPPILLNGQIHRRRGRHRLRCRRRRIVVEAQARALIPYLADAVPVGFGRCSPRCRRPRVACVDDYRAIDGARLRIPADGVSWGARCPLPGRGFVYRRRAAVHHAAVSLGRRRRATQAAIAGWNLPAGVALDT